VVEVRYYDGNKGSGRFEQVEYTDAGEMHFAGGDEEDVAAAAETWWHQAEAGGGSLVDYLGYGTNLATWFRDGELPLEVTTETHTPEWSEVDVQSITIADYGDGGLSTFETRWGTFTDPWVNQPQPKCGFVVTGTDGTISSYDYEETVRVQDQDNPEGYEVEVDELEAPLQDQVQYMVHCLETDQDVEFPPLSPSHCRESNRILVAARKSAEREEPVAVE
jgi:glucose-fructose oxidoreductase